MYQLLSHNDLDGVGCGIIAKLALGDEVNVLYNSVSGLNYQAEAFLEAGNKDVKLMITDLSVNEDNEKRITEWVNSGGEAVLIDHHKSALRLNEQSWAQVTVTQEDGKQTSATSLLYAYFIEKGMLSSVPAVSDFVELVRQYDTWEWDANGNFRAKKLNDLFFMFSNTEFEEKMLKKLSGDAEAFEFDDIETKLLEVEEERVERYINRKKREVYQTETDGLLAGVVHAESYHSELGNSLSKEFPHLDYIAIMMVGSKRISLRTSHDDIDVSAVAAKYEGGGHQKASGCSMTEQAYKEFIEATFFNSPIRRDYEGNRYNVKGTPQGSLYKGQEYLYIYYAEGKGWVFEIAHKLQDQVFPDFEEAERFVKRKYGAGLVKDDDMVVYLTRSAAQKK